MLQEPHDRSGGRATPQSAGGGNDGQSQSPAATEQALEAARKEASDNWDRYVRMRADMDNFKRRVERQYADLATSHKKHLLVKLLGVSDNLDRALRYQEGSAVDGDGLATGLRMTLWQMRELLKSEGLKEIPTVGERFDPRLHEAVDTVPGTPEQDGAIASESQRGYLFQDETLRPAKVTVIKSAT